MGPRRRICCSVETLRWATGAWSPASLVAPSSPAAPSSLLSPTGSRPVSVLKSSRRAPVVHLATTGWPSSSLLVAPGSSRRAAAAHLAGAVADRHLDAVDGVAVVDHAAAGLR